MKLSQIIFFVSILSFSQKIIAQSEKILFEGEQLDSAAFLQKQQIISISNSVIDSDSSFFSVN